MMGALLATALVLAPALGGGHVGRAGHARRPGLEEAPLRHRAARLPFRLSAEHRYHGPAVIAFTDWAVEILQRTWQAARRFDPDAAVRMQRSAVGVEFVLTDERAETDELVPGDAFELLVEEGLEGTVDVVEPHDRLILRPPGDAERSVKPH